MKDDQISDSFDVVYVEIDDDGSGVIYLEISIDIYSVSERKTSKKNFSFFFKFLHLKWFYYDV